MDRVDRKILDLLQQDFPLTVEPYKELARQVGRSEEEVLERIARLKEAGIIRRIGGIINARGLGWVTTLCAVSVPEDRIEEIAQRINAEPGVTHNYLRDHELNMWFTLIAPSHQEIEAILDKIETDTDLSIHNFPAAQTYKIKVSFDMRRGMIYDN